MSFQIFNLTEITILPTLFLGICIIYLLFFGVFICYNARYNFLIIQNSIGYLAVLILFMLSYLFTNEVNDFNYLYFNSSIASYYLSTISKLVISISLIIFSLMVQRKQFLLQKINHFEYILIFLFPLLGIFLFCSSNDFITAYFSIELQSLAFYIRVASKENSMSSVEAGLKYFVLGAFSSGLFLFGSSLLYGFSCCVNFTDFKNLFFLTISGHTLVTLQSQFSFDRFELIFSRMKSTGLNFFSPSECDCEPVDYFDLSFSNEELLKTHSYFRREHEKEMERMRELLADDVNPREGNPENYIPLFDENWYFFLNDLQIKDFIFYQYPGATEAQVKPIRDLLAYKERYYSNKYFFGHGEGEADSDTENLIIFLDDELPFFLLASELQFRIYFPDLVDSESFAGLNLKYIIIFPDELSFILIADDEPKINDYGLDPLLLLILWWLIVKLVRR